MELGRARRRPSAWVLAAVAAVLVPGVVIVSQGNDRATVGATTTTATASPKTTGPAPPGSATTEPATRASTTIERSTTTVAVVTTTEVGRIRADPPFEPASGLVVFLTTSDTYGEPVIVVDVDHGQLHEVDAQAVGASASANTIVLGDSMMVATRALG